MPQTRTVLGGRTTRSATPLVTVTVIVICVALWLGQQATPRVYQELAFAPALGEREPWRFLTSAFLHGPLIHIGFNMFALWMLGGYIEPLIGRVRFIALYLISALGGSVAFLWLNPTDSFAGVVGASGAVFGLFGAVVPLNRQLGRSSQWLWPNLILNAFLPFLYPSIAWQAHVGGFLTGMGLAWFMAQGRHRKRLPLLGTVAFMVVITAAAALRYATT